MVTQAENLLNVFTSQSFFDWYCNGGRFDNYIKGELPTPTKEDILRDIQLMLDTGRGPK